MTMDGRTRWLALYVLCLGSLMIVLDVTIVNVALPSVKKDLGFSETSLAWVVNAYLLTYGGFLLLGGRLGEEVHHQGERDGGCDRAADPLHRPGPDEQALRRREAAHKRGQGEERDPREEEPALAEEVAQPAAE